MKKLLLTLSVALLLICAVSCVIAEEKTGILIDTSNLVKLENFEKVQEFELKSAQFETIILDNAEFAKGSVFVELEAGNYTNVYIEVSGVGEIGSHGNDQFPVIAKGSESSYVDGPTDGFFTVSKGKVLDTIAIEVISE